MDYKTFVIGNNLWKRMPRFFMLSFERIGVIGVMFILSYLILNTLFSYDWRLSKVLFALVMIAFTIFLILPAPSMPFGVMYGEVIIRPIKGLVTHSVSSTAKIMPLEPEEKMLDEWIATSEGGNNHGI
ncbi:hypothetical protein JK159_02320 [Weissella minor]|uniref:hypothetical protein n=1 Tax=Weissella minor TaxID=1620 RepID=UPI001BAFEB70|nr:hypothetical protein [Weissella minor]MBS0949218.1 hypothetical protein [Weissella minor]